MQGLTFQFCDNEQKPFNFFLQSLFKIGFATYEYKRKVTIDPFKVFSYLIDIFNPLFSLMQKLKIKRSIIITALRDLGKLTTLVYVQFNNS